MKLLPPFVGVPEVNRVYHVDALTLLRAMADNSVDAFILDLPYGTTACSWDEIIPFEPMWKEVKRTLKPRGVFVTTASQPFTSKLVMSNLEMFRYEWIWAKTNSGDFMTADKRPRKLHENIVVFSHGAHNYYPQMMAGKPYIDKARSRTNRIHDSTMPKLGIVNEGTRYPSSVQMFSNGNNNIQHPTQKPVALYDYLIRTYTQPGDLVVDFCCGSGTTAVAAQALKRNFIACDTTYDYVLTSRGRLVTEFGARPQKAGTPIDDLPLFATA